mgnify:FL=1
MKKVISLYEEKYTDYPPTVVSFDKKELEIILKIYGQMVSKGYWRDYSISSSFSKAIFSVFRHSSEKPLYMIIKAPNQLKQYGQYSIVTTPGQIIHRGKNLQTILQILNKKLFKIV